MIKFRISFFVVLLNIANLFASSPVQTDSATAHMRSYQYSFNNGNLVPNWSFEDEYYFWESNRFSRAQLIARCGDQCQPVTGSYVAVADSVNGTMISSELVPVEGGATYSLSLFAYGRNVVGLAPQVFFYSDLSTLVGSAQGNDYSSEERWILHKDAFLAPSSARYAKIVLYPRSVTLNGRLYLDDVIFEKGTTSSSRASVGMTIAYGDALGRIHQQQQLIHREWVSELLPAECFSGYSVRGADLARIGSRAKVSGGYIGSDDSLFIDNDVSLPKPVGEATFLQAGGGIRMGDRDSITGDIEYGKALFIGNQSLISGKKTQSSSTSCQIPQQEVVYGSSDVYVGNDVTYTLSSGRYKDMMIRARSHVYLSAGDYYFKTFHIEPQAVLHFDLSGGNVRIFVQDELRIDDNTTFAYTQVSSNFIGWYTAQLSTLRLGTISNLSGVFEAPNARLELGHNSLLYGLMYAKEIYVMEDATLTTPQFIFHDPKIEMAVLGMDYDGLGRSSRSDMAFPAEMKSEGFVKQSLDHAKEYYSATGDGPDAGGYPYVQPVYSEQDGRLLEKSLPGVAWNILSEHTEKTDKFSVTSFDIPSSLDVTTLGASTSEDGAPYVLSWERNAQGALVLSWADLFGHTVQTAAALDSVGNNLQNWNWAIKKYEYTLEGRLKKVYTPLDVQSGSDDFSSFASYDAQGRIVAKSDPDRGLEKYYYAVDGTYRFSQTEEQRQRSAYSYVDYDVQGRQISSGETILTGVTDNQVWQIAESSDSIPGTLVEYSGRAYDRQSVCLEKIGVAGLSDWLDTLTLNNTRNRLICTWYRNPKMVDEIGALRALVVDVYSYNEKGKVVQSWRYTGAVNNTTQRTRSLKYVYDELDRIWQSIYYDGTGNELARSVYHYDEKGRLASISDMNSKNVVAYTYDDMGNLDHAQLGEDVNVAYTYHLHGLVKSIEATRISTGTVLYRQDLGYEEAVADSFAEARFDGRIAQNRIQFAPDAVLSPEKISNYLYDDIGRLTKKQGISDSLIMSYDINDRIAYQMNNAEMLNYAYNSASYRLDHVTGTTPLAPNRDMSTSGNFQWDASGRMIYDASKNLSINYDITGLPVVLRIVDAAGTDQERTFRQTQLYGPDGYRVATMDWVDSADDSHRLVQIRSDIRLGERKRGEIWENYAAADTTLSEYTMIQGSSSIVGRTRPDGLAEWYLKDYQGSLALSIVGNGYGSAFEYQPFGAQTQLRSDGQPPTEQYTGKEWNGTYGYYYYGARFLDPVLGMWGGPDPASQYANPYAFGWDPMNGVDLYGLWKLGLGITIGWDSDNGFSLGVGVAADVGSKDFGLSIDMGASYGFKNDSWTYSANVGAGVNIGIVSVGGNLGASYNTKSGATLNYGINAGVYGVGVGVGGAQYWDTDFDYKGSTLYVQMYGGAFGVTGYNGYEWGFGEMEGRGWYVGTGGWGLYAEYSENGGFHYGGNTKLAHWDTENGLDYVGQDLIEALMTQEDYSMDELESFRGEDGKWGKTNYCGAGGGGGVTDAVDNGCYAHDKRYDAAGGAGALSAFFDVSAKIVAADISLSLNSWANSHENSLAGFEVGTVFTVISAYKVPVLLTKDLLNNSQGSRY